VYTLSVVDVGGSILIHMFGGFFGIGASWALFSRSDENVAGTLERRGSYHSEIGSMLGTLFLWVLFPSFNAAFVIPDQQAQTIVNTILSLASSATFAAAISHLRGPEKNRFEMEDIRNATLAGGVAVSASANLVLSPWAAILIGCCSGFLSVLCNWKFSPFMAKKCGLLESRPVVALHAVIGLAGGLISVAATAGAANNTVPSWELHFYQNNLSAYLPKGSMQPVIQVIAIAITMGIAVLGGFMTGVCMWWVRDKKFNHLHPDEHVFNTPKDYKDY